MVSIIRCLLAVGPLLLKQIKLQLRYVSFRDMYSTWSPPRARLLRPLQPRPRQEKSRPNKKLLLFRATKLGWRAPSGHDNFSLFERKAEREPVRQPFNPFNCFLNRLRCPL